jgi:hypothetical protein
MPIPSSGAHTNEMLPNAAPNATPLAKTVLAVQLPPEVIQQRVHEVQDALLANSDYIREPCLTAIHPRDLEVLFAAYDERFFEGLCRRALDGRRLNFRLSRRMTRAGGSTSRLTTRGGEVRFEISVAAEMLFECFGESDRQITVCGLVCETRLEALQRIFEHELVHLVEQLCWATSNCSARRFQDIAHRCFLHQTHTHNLITRRERAARLGIRVGCRVVFTFEGRQLTGRVNQITKRATVLVEEAGAPRYSDGRHYRRYYVPIGALQLMRVDSPD